MCDEELDCGSESVEEPDRELQDLTEIVLNTREQCEMFERLINNQIVVKDELIDSLHADLQYYKQDLAEKFVVQLMKDVIRIRNEMLRNLESDDWTDSTLENLQKEYTYVFEDLTELLEQQNVEIFRTNEGEDFDASIHSARMENTDEPSLEKKIKKSLGCGYKRDGKVVQLERVVVYKYKE